MPRTRTPEHDSSAGTYPARRVFVIKLHAGAHPAAGVCSGRLEHVLTGRQRAFGNASELLAALEGDGIDTAPQRIPTPKTGPTP